MLEEFKSLFDKQLYINELKCVFQTDNDLKIAVTGNKDIYFEFQQHIFDLWKLD